MNDVFFIEKSFLKIGEGIYLYKNFLNKNEFEKFNKIFDEYVSQNKLNSYNNGIGLNNKVTFQIPEVKEIRNKMIALLGNYYNIGLNTSVNVMSKGDYWNIHSDNYEFKNLREKNQFYVEGKPYNIVQDNRYGMVVYFNDFEGGEIFYPQQYIVYKPKPGDLLIHSSEENCEHGVAVLKSEYRYSYSNFLSQNIKINK